MEEAQRRLLMEQQQQHIQVFTQNVPPEGQHLLQEYRFNTPAQYPGYGSTNGNIVVPGPETGKGTGDVMLPPPYSPYSESSQPPFNPNFDDSPQRVISLRVYNGDFGFSWSMVAGCVVITRVWMTQFPAPIVGDEISSIDGIPVANMDPRKVENLVNQAIAKGSITLALS